MAQRYEILMQMGQMYQSVDGTGMVILDGKP